MTENMDIEQTEVAPVENDEPILPDGWDGVGDIFEAGSWTDPTAVGLEGFATEQTSVEAAPTEETPATEPEPEGTAQEGTAETEPVSEPAAPS